jgi:ferredoxin
MNTTERRKNMPYRIVVDRELCSGFGSCIQVDPETFALGSDGIAVALVASTDRDAAVSAARSCPMGAILVLDGAEQAA